MTDTARPMVLAEQVRKSFGQLEVLKGIDLAVAPGEILGLIGPSGSGKTTLLRCVNHLEKIDAGRLSVDGALMGYREEGDRLREVKPRDLARSRVGIGMVFQGFNLFQHLTVMENLVEGPVQVRKEPRAAATERARILLDRVGLADKAAAYPRQLSGGQQQRVAIARALNMQPKLMLFDEPTSALDPELVGEVLDVIRDVADDGMTMMIVTHEIKFIREIADRVAFMDGGVVVELGPPSQVIDAPVHERTKSFLERVL